MLNALALIGGVLLGVCPIPEAYKAFRNKRAENSWAFLACWGIGDLCLLAYGIGTNLPIAIILNNVLNAVCIGIICWFK